MNSRKHKKVRSDYSAESVTKNRKSKETEQMQKVMEIMSRYPNALAGLAKPKEFKQKTRIR